MLHIASVFCKPETWITITADEWLGIWGERAVLLVCFSLFKRTLEGVIGALVIRQGGIWKEKRRVQVEQCTVIVVMQFSKALRIEWKNSRNTLHNKPKRLWSKSLIFFPNNFVCIFCFWFSPLFASLSVINPLFLCYLPHLTFYFSSCFCWRSFISVGLHGCAFTTISAEPYSLAVGSLPTLVKSMFITAFFSFVIERVEIIQLCHKSEFAGSKIYLLWF